MYLFCISYLKIFLKFPSDSSTFPEIPENYLEFLASL